MLSRRLLAILPLLATAAVAAAAQPIGTPERPLRIGVTAGPHARVIEKVREIAARPDGPGQALVLHIVTYQDFQRPNAALAAGEIDANSFQHQPFLDQQARDRGLPIVSVGKTLVFPMGVYSRRHAQLAELPGGAQLAIPGDPSNGARALALLAAQGLIRLRDGAGLQATVADVTENPRRLRILSWDAAQLPRALEEVDAAAITSNFALLAGLSPVRDAIAIESADSPYANVIAVRAEDRAAPWVARLLAAYHSAEIRDFVASSFDGVAVTAF